jgi:hypothetical protein
VSGKTAGSFSVSGLPLSGKEAAAVSKTSRHIKRTPHINMNLLKLSQELKQENSKHSMLICACMLV